MSIADTRDDDAEIGGADRDRTDDPLLAKQVLSQLSYSPSVRIENPDRRIYRFASLNSQSGMVGLGRFELPTSRLSGVRSNQLSYRPVQLQRVDRSYDSASHLPQYSFVRERRRKADALKTEQDRRSG